MEELFEAIEQYMEAKMEYKEAAKNCQYDRDYFLHREISEVEKSKEKMESAFHSAVSKIVVQIINSKSYLPN